MAAGQALFFACGQGNAEMASAILSGGEACDVNQTFACGLTALMRASMDGHARCVELLLLATAALDVNGADTKRMTALHYAARGGHVDVIRRLLAREGIETGSADEQGRTALDWAVANGHAEAEALLGGGGDGGDDGAPGAATAPAKVVHIGVGTQNAAKLKAVAHVAALLFGAGGFELHPSTCASGVPEQPMSAAHCMAGATARARASRVAGGADHEYGVGLEGGLEKIEGGGGDGGAADTWLESGWMVVERRGAAQRGIGTSARFEVRGEVLRRLLAGEEMCDVVDELSGDTDVRSKGGMMGTITNGALPRDECYRHGLLFAFAPFVSPPQYWE